MVVEAESSKIGALILPPSLWTALRAAPRIWISAPIAARSAYLASAYDDILSDGDRLRERLSPLRVHRGNEVVKGWLALIDSGDKQALTRALMEQHYDPSYAKSNRSQNAEVLAQVNIPALDETGLNDAAARIGKILDQL